MIVRSLAIAILAVGLAGPALAQQGGAQGTDRQQIETFMNQWVDAYNRGDSQKMAALTAADALGVGDQGVVSGNDRFARAMQSAAAYGAKVTGMQVEQVRMIGRDAAVAAGDYSVTYNYPDPLTTQGTWMQVLERQYGIWKSVAESYTPSGLPALPAAEGSSTH